MWVWNFRFCKATRLVENYLKFNELKWRWNAIPTDTHWQKVKLRTGRTSFTKVIFTIPVLGAKCIVCQNRNFPGHYKYCQNERGSDNDEKILFMEDIWLGFPWMGFILIKGNRLICWRTGQRKYRTTHKRFADWLILSRWVEWNYLVVLRGFLDWRFSRVARGVASVSWIFLYYLVSF
jgi:hypothetical protein